MLKSNTDAQFIIFFKLMAHNGGGGYGAPLGKTGGLGIVPMEHFKNKKKRHFVKNFQ
jgi:hypothetical protein